MEDILPKKCGVKYSPPTLVLFYTVKSSGKIHRRSIPIRLNENTNEEKLFTSLLKESHHSKYLKKFKHEQIERLFKMLMTNVNGNQTNLNAVIQKEAVNVDFETENLNKLDDETLNKVKGQMNEVFQKNQIKPGDSAWKYDVEVDFSNNDGVAKSFWDEDDSESDMEF